jgi:hypothetical protein
LKYLTNKILKKFRKTIVDSSSESHQHGYMLNINLKPLTENSTKKKKTKLKYQVLMIVNMPVF